MEKVDAINKLNLLKKKIGKTPLVQITTIDVPNNCKIFLKEEYKNPTHSHYDRQTPSLLIDALDRDQFSPGEKVVVESTTGSSGASFAWMCRCIETEAVIFIPEEMPLSRRLQLEAFGAKVITSEKGKYVKGIFELFESWHSRGADIPGLGVYDEDKHYCLLHANDRHVGPEAMLPMWTEIESEIEELTHQQVGYFVTALGNGTSIGGIIDTIKSGGTSVVGFEPLNSPTLTQIVFPDRFAKIYDGVFPGLPHSILGTGPGELDRRVRFPNLQKIKKKLDDIILVDDANMMAFRDKLHFDEFILAGNSTAAAVYSACEVAKNAPEGSIICAVAYDPAWRYLDGG